MQRVLYKDVVDPDIERRLRPQCACAWEKLEGRKATLLMKPAPKPIDVADRRNLRRRPGSGDSNPTAVPTDLPPK